MADPKSILDYEIVNSLKDIDENNPSFFLELIDLYVKQFIDKLRMIDELMTSNDQAKIAGLLHQMKSSSGNVGATPLYEYCQKLETAAKNTEITSAEIVILKEMFSLASSELETVCSELKRKLFA